MGRVGSEESRRLLDVAYDAGIRHFDAAPLYGYGAVEGMLGLFAAGKRDGITIATKFGIYPPEQSLKLRIAKAGARVVTSIFPGLRAKLRKRAESLVVSGSFELPQSKASLERSLRQLQTSYIDFYLMHEIAAAQVSPELIEFLQEAKDRGSIRDYGPASSASDAVKIAAAPDGCTVFQFPSNLLGENVASFPPQVIKITHSAVRPVTERWNELFSRDPALLQTWSKQLDENCSDSAVLANLLLAAALEENPGGIVLFSSLNPKNIQRNAQLMQEERFPPEQLQTLRNLAADLARNDGR